MSCGRSGYYDDSDSHIHFINYRGAVTSSIRGRRGQAFLKELLSAMDAMPVKRLIAHELFKTERVPFSISHWGIHECEIESHCTLGVIGRFRGLDLNQIDPDDYSYIHAPFDIANAMAREIEYVNDEGGKYQETPEERFARVRKWVEDNIRFPWSPSSVGLVPESGTT